MSEDREAEEAKFAKELVSEIKARSLQCEEEINSLCELWVCGKLPTEAFKEKQKEVYRVLMKFILERVAKIVARKLIVKVLDDEMGLGVVG